MSVQTLGTAQSAAASDLCDTPISTGNERLRGKRILIADDDFYFRSILQKSLALEGCLLTCAENGRHAKEVIGLEEFDLVISDIRMPEVTGLELLHWIKANRPVPTVLMTGFAEILETKEAANLGASGFLTKPFKREELIGVIVSGLRRNESEEQKPNLDAEFCKLGIEDFVSGKEIRFDIFVRISESKYVKVSHCGENIAIERIRAYKSKGIHFLHMRKEDFRKYLNFNLNLVKAVTQSNTFDRLKKLNFVKHASEVFLESFYCTEINRDDYMSASALVENSVAIVGEDMNAVDLLGALANHTDFLYAHSVGVRLYATLIGKAMGWKSAATILKLSMAGLLHDVGKREIAREILEKRRSDLTQSQITVLESHTIRGAELLSCLPNVPTDVLQVVHEHHEDCMGMGYPKHLRKSKIHPMARVVAVANDFCGLVIKNPNCPGIKPSEAISRMALALERYDEAPFRALIRIFGFTRLESGCFEERRRKLRS